jgi:ribosome-associated protein
MRDLPVARGVSIPERELRFRFSRSSGPGGQNVNRRDTRVELIFDVARSRSLDARSRAKLMTKLGHRIDAEGCLHVVASSERTQAQNRARAVERLRRLLADALTREPKPRVATRPSKSAEERRIAAKKRRARLKRARARPGAEE